MRKHSDLLRLLHVASGLRLLPAASLLAGSLLMSGPAWSASPSNTAPGQNSAPAAKASFAHSGLKTVTYEIGNTLNNFVFLSVGAGDLAGGLLLTTFNTMQSWTVYTTNDYFWEKFYPREPANATNGAFDVQQSFWHTTLKYMTGKPVVASIKIAALYAYTGSVATAFAYGTAATAGASVIFFTNNLAWDFYDQSIAPRLWSRELKIAQARTATAE